MRTRATNKTCTTNKFVIKIAQKVFRNIKLALFFPNYKHCTQKKPSYSGT